MDAHAFNYIVLRVKPGLTSCEDLATALSIRSKKSEYYELTGYMAPLKIIIIHHLATHTILFKIYNGFNFKFHSDIIK